MESLKTINMKKTALFISFVFAAVAVSAQTLSLDASNSTLGWVGKKVTGQHNGYLKFESGKLELDGENIKGGNFVVDMTSLTVEDIKDEKTNGMLVGHLKSDDFFSVETYPKANLVVEKATKSGETYTITGKLTIKGATHPITFDAVREKKSDGTQVFTGNVVVDRTLYNVKYGSGKFFASLGDNMIYDEFTLDFKIVLK